ncbi:MAG: hypothetical protein LBG96_15745 [Tannerella sp.]|jgi:hypothetical protein|nr:hypothetical protein [Tannerella sp.]
MEKYYSLILLLLLVSCGKNDSGEKETPVIKPESEFTLKDKGWDIYAAGEYRYGPSIIINDDGSIDAWFSAPGAQYGGWKALYDKEATHTAQGITGQNTVAQKFTVGIPFWSIKVISPNWHNSPCGFTFNLYRWDDDKMSYADVIKQSPVATGKFKDYKDGSKLGVSNDDKFPAGAYLWVLSEGLTEQSGVWLSQGAVDNVISYKNGVVLNGENWNAAWSENPASDDVFWDQASYRHSTDGGKTWSEDMMALLPTEFTSDHYSVCDPGVAFWNGYYYIGYTSTENIAGTQNNVYVARGKTPYGPWEKWDGDTWGTDTKPVIRYDGDPEYFGAGEPSMVVLNDIVYFYYTWNDGTFATRVATVSAKDPDWPKNLEYHGVAMDKSAIDGADHSDVKYKEDTGKFYAINTASRMTEQGYLVLWQSDDGITFKKIAEIRNNLMPGIHNCGWSGDRQGHIKPAVQQYLSYAYGIGSWGMWNTRWVEIKW